MPHNMRQTPLMIFRRIRVGVMGGLRGRESGINLLF